MNDYKEESDGFKKSVYGQPTIDASVLMPGVLAKLQKRIGVSLDPHLIERELMQQGSEARGGDHRAIESLLSMQCQALQFIVMDMLERLAEADTDEKVALYTSLALKAQNYTRATLQTLENVNKGKDFRNNNYPSADYPKFHNELMERVRIANMEMQKRERSQHHTSEPLNGDFHAPPDIGTAPPAHGRPPEAQPQGSRGA